MFVYVCTFVWVYVCVHLHVCARVDIVLVRLRCAARARPSLCTRLSKLKRTTIPSITARSSSPPSKYTRMQSWEHYAHTHSHTHTQTHTFTYAHKHVHLRTRTYTHTNQPHPKQKHTYAHTHKNTKHHTHLHSRRTFRSCFWTSRCTTR